jgi:hypothetical protein
MSFNVRKPFMTFISKRSEKLRDLAVPNTGLKASSSNASHGGKVLFSGR